MLTGVALILYVFEMNLPALSPVPGVKLGLSNIVTVYTAFTLTPWDTLTVLISRLLLGTLITGNLPALMYSAAGAALSILLTLCLRRVLTDKQLWAAGAAGAAAHGLGQILIAVAVTGTPGLFAYLPLLTATGIVAGCFTGACAQFLRARFTGDLKRFG